MRLSEIFEDIPNCVIRGNTEADILDICDDSRECSKGSLFAAIRGNAGDGRKYIAKAIENGAVALLVPEIIQEVSVPQIVAEDERSALASAMAKFSGSPSDKLKLIGITGTNGKTTTAFLIRHILNNCGCKCGMMGTILYDDGEKAVEAPLTTPGPVRFTRTLAEMVKNGCTHAVAEISSHALSQGRAAGNTFSAAVFTNLTRDHLDYHGDMENYFSAKSQLFEHLSPEKSAIINKNSPFAKKLAERSAGKNVFYGSDGDDLKAEIIKKGLSGTEIRFEFASQFRIYSSGLIGSYNVENLSAALLCVMELGIDVDSALEALDSFAGVPGRLERVFNDHDLGVFVDYAHTDDALRGALTVLRPLTDRRLIVVFGCGGDRDRGKRPLMARATEESADIIICTSDNPRTEDQDRIFADIYGGFKKPENIIFETDRKAAIEIAIGQARAGDAVLIAGKGHENYQIIGTEKRHLDDRELAKHALDNYGK